MKGRCKTKNNPIMRLALMPVLVMVLLLSVSGTAMAQVAPDDPADHNQYKADGTTAIAEGGTTDQTTVRIKATVSDGDADNVQLQVEIISETDYAANGDAFYDTPNCVSAFVADGAVATASCSGLTVGTTYRWQARTYDDTGATSAWVFYGVEATADVQVASNYLIHSSTSVGSDSGWGAGGWGIAGGKYGEFTCETCHTFDPANTNIKMIRGTITNPGAEDWEGTASPTTGPIVFTQADGTSSDMGDNVGPPYNGVCNVCHSDAKHSHYSLGADGDGHNVGTDCTACHQHRKGFKGLDCNGCHGGTGGNTTGAPFVTGDLVGEQDAYYPTTGHDEGAHPKHVTDQGITNCEVCHSGNGMPTVDEVITIAFSGTATDNSSSPSYDGTALDSPYSYAGDVTGPAGVTQDCSNVYCHSSVQGASGTGVPGSYATPDWGAASVTCDSCHGQAAETDGRPDSGSHATHAGNANENYDCSTCHTGGSGTLEHADGTIDMDISATYGASAAYSQGSTAPDDGYGDCSNVYCHGDTLTAGTDTQPTWGGAVACGECHGDDAANPPTAGSHERHAGSGVFNVTDQGLNVACTDCHGAGAGGTGHVDEDVAWNLSAIDAAATYSGSNTGSTGGQAPSVSYGTCSSVYCHSNVQTASGTADEDTYATPTWGAASVTCDSCHGQDAEETDGQPASGSHDKHAGSQAGEKNYDCAVCHNNGGDESANHANSIINLDIDGTYDLGGTAAYSQGDHAPGSGGYGTCSNVSCHAGTDTPTWGSALPNAADCSDCHGNDRNTTTGQLVMSSGKHTAHVNNTDAELGSFDCGRCHADTVTTGDNQTITGALHQDLSNDVVYDALNASATDNTCNTVYCHSDGKGGYNDQVLSSAWSTGAAIGCDGCHGDTSSTFGEPDYISGAAGSSTANSHGAHVSVATDCGSCHTSTSTTGTDITGALHINENIDVTIAAAYDSDANPANNYTPGDTFRTCSNVYCHSNGLGTYATPQWGGTSTGCDFCHDDLPSSGAHGAHVQTAAVAYGSTSVNTTGGTYDFGCANCHPVTESGNHRDGDIDITMNSTHGGTLKSLNNVSDDTSGYFQDTGVEVTCSAAYCHSKGEGTFVTSPDWYGASAGDSCAVCHGNSPDTNAHSKHVVGIHYDSIYTGTTGLATAGTGNTDSHGSSTYSTTINCNTCHNNTVTASANDQNTLCATCHDDVTATLQGDMTIAAGSTAHLSGTVDVAFAAVDVRSKAQLRDDITVVTELDESWTRDAVGYKAAGAYDQANSTLDTATMYNSTSKSCATVACHNGNTAVWGATGTSCTYCHTDLPR